MVDKRLERQVEGHILRSYSEYAMYPPLERMTVDNADNILGLVGMKKNRNGVAVKIPWFDGGEDE